MWFWLFEMAKQDCLPSEHEDEMTALKNSLESTSFRGVIETFQERVLRYVHLMNICSKQRKFFKTIMNLKASTKTVLSRL